MPVLWIVLGVPAIFLVLLLAAANYSVSQTLRCKNALAQKAVSAPVAADLADGDVVRNAQAIWAETDVWLQTCPQETVSVSSGDGLRLWGLFLPAATDSHLYVIEVHGYTGSHTDVLGGAWFFAQRGFHVLTPDLRAHGQSEGKYIGMGWPDRKDMLRWIDWIVQRDPRAQIVLSGVSMGSATVMMTAGEALPANVKAAVADCGYTSAWDEMAHVLRRLFHLPPFPLLHATGLLCKLRAGYFLGQASAVKQIQNSKIPVFFVHGAEDTFVPTHMVYSLYDACPTQKELLVVKGAGHGTSLYKDPETYSQRLFAFLDRVLDYAA